MIASELKVYRDTYELVRLLMQCTRDYPKLYKYTLGEKTHQVSLELFEYIQLANMFKSERVKYLNGFIVKFELLKVLVKLACDEKILSLGRQARIAQLTVGIGRQITAWKNSPVRGEVQKP